LIVAGPVMAAESRADKPISVNFKDHFTVAMDSSEIAGVVPSANGRR
jgi:hypothetical protein